MLLFFEINIYGFLLYFHLLHVMYYFAFISLLFWRLDPYWCFEETVDNDQVSMRNPKDPSMMGTISQVSVLLIFSQCLGLNLISTRCITVGEDTQDQSFPSKLG